MNLDALLAAISSCTDEEKLDLFNELRKQISFHNLEREFGIKAERILDAITRGSDLTKRGIRGVIAETVFATEIAPTIRDWIVSNPIGDVAYDVLFERAEKLVRVQVKMQRKGKGAPLLRRATPKGPKDHFVVEVQRTRSGKTGDGVSTRPYRFGEFDLLAVCMEPSTKDWQSFLYIAATDLAARPGEADRIDTMQPIPPYPALNSPIWTTSLPDALERVVK